MESPERPWASGWTGRQVPWPVSVHQAGPAPASSSLFRCRRVSHASFHGVGMGAKSPLLYTKWDRPRDSSLFPLIFLLQILNCRMGRCGGWGSVCFLFRVHFGSSFRVSVAPEGQNTPPSVWSRGCQPKCRPGRGPGRRRRSSCSSSRSDKILLQPNAGKHNSFFKFCFVFPSEPYFRPHRQWWAGRR